MAALLCACPDEPPVDSEGGVSGNGPILVYDAGPAVPLEDAGSGEEDGGALGEDAGDVNNGNVGVMSVTPPNGPLSGGNRVRIEGWGFTPTIDDGGDMRVFFAEHEATGCLYQGNDRVTCFVPPCDEAGPVDVRVENSLGVGVGEGIYTCFSPVTLASITPSSGSVAGGTAVTLAGSGLSPEMIVLIGGRQVVSMDVADDGLSATMLTPPGGAGRVDVLALDVFGRSKLELGFRYVGDLAIDDVSPAAAEAGAVVDVFGAGFDASCTVQIGSAAAVVDNFVDDERLRVRVPALTSGSYDVTVECAAGAATLAGGLFVLPPPSGALAVLGAVPPRGDSFGGTVVRLAGEGFTTTTGVTFAGVAAGSVEIESDRVLRVVAPAGTAGAAQLEVTTSALGSATFDGFVYYDALAAVGVSPARGATTGGTLVCSGLPEVCTADPTGVVTLSGRAFADGMSVTVGGVAVQDLVVVDESTATFTPPPGSSGPADVVVVKGDEVARLDDGFLYDAALRVLGVYPTRGGIAGNTYVTVTGQGFARDGVAFVLFGDQQASDVEVISDSIVVARTPFHEPGVVDVTVQFGQTALDSEVATAGDVFTYFNPEFILGGTRGGPIDGAVYVTVLDAIIGLPVPNLVVFLGTEGEGEHMALTNVMGQATVSHPDIVGPQTVSVVGDGWEYASLVDVNASEITLYLEPLTMSPPQPGPMPPPPPPATIRGRVFGFAKEFFDPAALGPDEIALAVVVTTARNEFSGTPNPGGENVVFQEGGEYFIAQSRQGVVALVALAGIFNLETGQLKLRQMGVRRNVRPVYGVDLVEQDITLTVRLDEEIDLSLPDAPVGLEGGPTVTRVIPFLRFGGEGALAYTTAVDTTRNHDLDEMPDVPGEMLTFVAGAFTTDGAGLIDDVGTLDLVEGEPFAYGTGTSWAAVDMFGTPLVAGGILVVETSDGHKWATEVVTPLDDGTILLDDKAPFSTTAAGYHIGDPTYPSSVVLQDGVGDLIGGVLIHPVLGLPEPLSPIRNGVLDDRTLRWKPAAGQQPTNHLAWVYEPFEFTTLWTFYLDGTRTKVPIPRIPENVGVLPVENVPKDMPAGGYAWQHMSMYVPGFDYNNFSYLDLSSRSRRAWTNDAFFFIYPGN